MSAITSVAASVTATDAATSADFIETQDDFGQTFKLSSVHGATPTVLEMRLRRIYETAYGISQGSRQQTPHDKRAASLIFLLYSQAHIVAKKKSRDLNI